MSVGVFISYRRTDTADLARRVRSQLDRLLAPGKNELPRDPRRVFDDLGPTVFLDESDIEPGTNWPRRLLESLEQRETILILVGQTWSSPENIARLSSEHDWVRRELELALLRHERGEAKVLVATADVAPAWLDALPEALGHIRDFLGALQHARLDPTTEASLRGSLETLLPLLPKSRVQRHLEATQTPNGHRGLILFGKRVGWIPPLDGKDGDRIHPLISLSYRKKESSWLAWRESSKELVVLKWRPSSEQNGDLLLLANAERSALIELSDDDGVVGLVDGSDDWHATTLVAGGSLQQRVFGGQTEDQRVAAQVMLDGRALPDLSADEHWPLLRAVLSETARILRRIHARGFVHRNIKASNVLLRPEHDGTYRPVLCGFDSVQRVPADAGKVDPKHVCSRSRRPPELATRGGAGDVEVLQRVEGSADVYGLALLVCEVIDRRELGARTPAALLSELRVRRRLPPPLARILHRALGANPAARPSPEEMADILEECHLPSALAEQDWRKMRRRSRAAFVFGSVLAILVAFGVASSVARSSAIRLLAAAMEAFVSKAVSEWTPVTVAEEEKRKTTGLHGPTGRVFELCSPVEQDATSGGLVIPARDLFCIRLVEQRLPDRDETLWFGETELTRAQHHQLCSRPEERAAVPEKDARLPISLDYAEARRCTRRIGRALRRQCLAPECSTSGSRAARMPTREEWLAAARWDEGPPFSKGATKAFAVVESNEPREARSRDREWRQATNGLFDLYGNLAEWTHDGKHVLGGSFRNQPEDLRNDGIIALSPAEDGRYGLRVVVDGLEPGPGGPLILPTSWPLPAVDLDRSLEISGMAWHGDRLVLLPQMDYWDDDHETMEGLECVDAWFLQLSRDELVEAVGARRNESDSILLRPTRIPVRFVDDDAEQRCVPTDRVPGQDDWVFDGYEAIAFDGADGDRFHLISEIRSKDRQTIFSCLNHGELVDDGSKARVELTPDTCTSQAPNIPENWAAESLLVVGADDYIVLPERPEGMVWRCNGKCIRDVALRSEHELFRATDATELREGLAWVLDNIYVNELSPPKGRDAGILLGDRERRAHERVVEIRLVRSESEEYELIVTRPPLEWPEIGTVRNWEGIARLDVDGQAGVLMVTDEYPETLLAWLPVPEAGR